MGITERKERERASRRESIIDAAEKVIFERGFEEATMDDIAVSAELSKGTLYLYFENKTELYLAICQRGSNKLNNRFSEILASGNSGLDLIRMMGRAYINFVTQEPLYFRAFVFYESIHDEGFLEKSDFAHNCEENSRDALIFIAKALETGMEDGTIDDKYDPKELAVMIWASSRGIVQLAHMKSKDHHFKILDEIDLNIESMFEQFIDLLSEGLANKIDR